MPTKKPGNQKQPPTAEQFVQAWMKAGSVADVCKALGMKPGTVQNRVDYYRKKGVKLPKLGRAGEKLDVPALNALITKMSKKG